MSPFEVAAFIVSMILCAGALVVIIRGNIAKKHAPEMKKRAVETVVPLLKEIFGDGMTYEPGGRIGDEELAEAEFAAGYNMIQGSDLVTARYRGIPIRFSDVKLIEKVDRRDNRTGKMKTEYIEVFGGFWMIAEFDHDLTAIPLRILCGTGNRDIEMENDLFNQKFGVYCPDPHTAFYIMTPHFMERLLAAETITIGGICIRLDQNKVQIAVNHGDHFELGYYEKLTPEEIQAKFRGEIREITNILDLIMGHERLFGSLSPAKESETGNQ